MTAAKICCIYSITCSVTGHQYIGSTINSSQRKSIHFSSLKHNKHHSSSMQKEYNLYGKEFFTYTILELVTKNTMLTEEQKYLDALNPFFNTEPTAGSRKGRNVSTETRNKIANSLKDHPVLPATREKLSKAAKGKPFPIVSVEQKAKSIEKMKETKKRNSAVTSQQMKEIWKKRKEQS